MLANRLFSRRFVRLYSSNSSTSSVKKLTKDEVEIIDKPNEQQLESFMKWHGKNRAVFKRNDIDLWKNSFPDGDYTVKLLMLKGTDQVIGTSHVLITRPLDPSVNKTMYFAGLGWLDKKASQMKATPFLSEMLSGMSGGENANTVAYSMPTSRQFWHKMLNKKEDLKTGSTSGEVVYMSHYNFEDFFIPENLSFDGITVKSAHEVPKKHIIDYDQKIHPFHRERYIVSHMRDPAGFGKVAYNDEGKVVGLGQAVIYPKGDCNLGPFYAEDGRIVQALFHSTLKDIHASGRKMTVFEIRTTQHSKDSFKWIQPFLKVPATREHAANVAYRLEMPKNIDYSRAYCHIHPQVFVV